MANKNEILHISKTFGILTPYTAFVVSDCDGEPVFETMQLQKELNTQFDGDATLQRKIVEWAAGAEERRIKAEEEKRRQLQEEEERRKKEEARIREEEERLMKEEEAKRRVEQEEEERKQQSIKELNPKKYEELRALERERERIHAASLAHLGGAPIYITDGENFVVNLICVNVHDVVNAVVVADDDE